MPMLPKFRQTFLKKRVDGNWEDVPTEVQVSAPEILEQLPPGSIIRVVAPSEADMAADDYYALQDMKG